MARKDNTPIFELLAPAGSPAILEAVIKAGADAVYLGGDRYGARAYAENFSQEKLLWALDYAHIRGRKIYLTVNTLMKNDEIKGLCDYIAPLYEQGLDAVLVQDFGALHVLRDEFPELPIHASTQMTLTGADGVRFLQEQGVQRVVLSRELSLEEAARIHEETGMELEVFVHGALCYCYSGQCLFSSMLGGRSGNRGRCAQPCRLPYTVSDEQNGKRLRDSYILSMKDLCGIDNLSALHQAGVYSLKIEGRMKQETYAAGVVSYYRKYIDSYILRISEDDFCKEVTREDKQAISDLGNRCGFTDGYYRKRNGSDMVTYEKPNFTTTSSAKAHESSAAFDAQGCERHDSAEAERSPRGRVGDKSPYSINQKIQISGKAVFRKGGPSEFSVWLDDSNIGDFGNGSTSKINDFDIIEKAPVIATVTGQTPDKAQKTPVTAEDLRQRLMKTGDTPFVFSELTLETEEDLFIPNGAVNHLRRDALEELEKAILAPCKRKLPGENMPDSLKESISQHKYAWKQESGWQQAAVSQQESTLQQESRRLIALVSNPEQLAAILADGRITDIYLETVTYPRAELLKELSHCLRMIEVAGQDYAVYLALPPIFRQHTREFYTSIVQQLPVNQAKLNEAHDTMSASEEGTCSHVSDERRMSIMNEVHDIMSSSDKNEDSKPKANVFIRGFLIRNFEEFAWAGEYFPQVERIIDHHLYTYNDAAVSAFFEVGARRNTVPLELNRSEVFGRDNRYSEMVVYGRYPLMLSAQCVHANSMNTMNAFNSANTFKSANAFKSTDSFNSGRSGCDKRSVITTLTDRKGVQFPVCNFCSECVNVIYNSVPTMLFGRINELEEKGIRSFRLEFTIESGKEISDILANLPWPDAGCESVKENTIGSPKMNKNIAHTNDFTAYTNGHYTRGVE